jgi:hypothetical protein
VTTSPTQSQIAADFLTPGYRIVGHIMVLRTGLMGLMNDVTTNFMEVLDAKLARLHMPTKLVGEYELIDLVKPNIFAVCLPRREDVAKEVRGSCLPQIPRCIGSDLDGRICRQSHFHKQVHNLAVTHPGKVRRHHGQIYITPGISLPQRMGSKEDDLLYLDLLLQTLDGQPDYFFCPSCRLSRFHRDSVCVKCSTAKDRLTFLVRFWMSGGYRLWI